ncbi:GNAT family N-acetyltransferase [Trebonia kvetii]|uniref:GNAT family N-acetyltransferase n=1 Tax=Trebonia kvetii TaxID=2480626 RepID=UPI0016526698|nr:GNAT family N-acetyltransferase [Trebonia kvetii]
MDMADGDLVRACHAVHVAAQEADDPQQEPPFSLQLFTALLTHGWGYDPAEAWYVPAGSTAAAGPSGVAAWCRVVLPDLENRDRAFIEPVVHPAFRRRGIGRGLLAHGWRRAAAGGRRFLDGNAIQGSAGEAFARSLGAEPGIVDARRILDLRKVPAGRFADLQAQAVPHAAGYSMLRWTGATPEAALGGVAGVLNAMNDAPREEGWFEDDIWDADRVRARGDMSVRLGGQLGYSVAAVHEETGEMAAMTQVFVDPGEPAWGRQGLTGVTRPHRGHRLGLLTKAAMLDWLATAEPGIERIETNNAEANSYMIAVNETLGYELAEPGAQFFALPVRGLLAGGETVQPFAQQRLLRAAECRLVWQDGAQCPGSAARPRVPDSGLLAGDGGDRGLPENAQQGRVTLERAAFPRPRAGGRQRGASR